MAKNQTLIFLSPSWLLTLSNYTSKIFYSIKSTAINIDFSSRMIFFKLNSLLNYTELNWKQGMLQQKNWDFGSVSLRRTIAFWAGQLFPVGDCPSLYGHLALPWCNQCRSAYSHFDAKNTYTRPQYPPRWKPLNCRLSKSCYWRKFLKIPPAPQTPAEVSWQSYRTFPRVFSVDFNSTVFTYPLNTSRSKSYQMWELELAIRSV